MSELKLISISQLDKIVRQGYGGDRHLKREFNLLPTGILFGRGKTVPPTMLDQTREVFSTEPSSIKIIDYIESLLEKEDTGDDEPQLVELPDKERGLYAKYIVSRADGKALKGEAIVLELGDPGVRSAVQEYSLKLKGKGYIKSHNDLEALLKKWKGKVTFSSLKAGDKFEFKDITYLAVEKGLGEWDAVSLGSGTLTKFTPNTPVLEIESFTSLHLGEYEK